MNTSEEVVRRLCPAMGREIKLRIIYDVATNEPCPLWTSAVSRQCLEDDSCQGWRHSKHHCLLFQDLAPLLAL